MVAYPLNIVSTAYMLVSYREEDDIRKNEKKIRMTIISVWDR